MIDDICDGKTADFAQTQEIYFRREILKMGNTELAAAPPNPVEPSSSHIYRVTVDRSRLGPVTILLVFEEYFLK